MFFSVVDWIKAITNSHNNKNEKCYLVTRIQPDKNTALYTCEHVIFQGAPLSRCYFLNGTFL